MANKKEASRLAAFLLALQTSQSVQARYKKEPKAEMKRFDLSSSTIEAVCSSDEVTLWRTLTIGHQVGLVVGVGRRGRRRKSKRT